VYVRGGVIATNLTAKNTTASSAAKKKSQSKVQPQGTLGTGIATTDIVFITGDGAVYDSPYTPGGNPTVANLLVGQNTEVAPTIPANPGSSPSLVSSYIPYEEVLNVADMNGDGLQDLVVYGNAAVYVFPNSGNGAFTTAPTQVAGATGGDQQPQPADFDGSGFNSFVNVDFILNQIGYYQNLGGISASQAGQFFATPLVTGANANYGNYGLFGGNVNVQAAADLNGDGLQDIVAYDWSKQAIVNGVYYPDISIGINNGAATGANQVNGFTFTTAVTAASLSTLGGGLAFVEPVTITNSAGNSILIVTNQGLYISTSKAGGAFSTPAALNLGITTGCPLSYADVADINGDGNPDIVIAYGGDASCGGGGSTASGYFTLLGNLHTVRRLTVSSQVDQLQCSRSSGSCGCRSSDQQCGAGRLYHPRQGRWHLQSGQCNGAGQQLCRLRHRSRRLQFGRQAGSDLDHGRPVELLYEQHRSKHLRRSACACDWRLCLRQRNNSEPRQLSVVGFLCRLQR